MLTMYRRSLLKSLGLLPAAATALKSRRARAATPLRFLLYYTGQGTIWPYWRPTGIGGGQPTKDSWEFADNYKVLDPYKDRLNLISGLDYQSWRLQKDTQGGTDGNAHIQGEVHALSNVISGSGVPGGPTVDQVIAQTINKDGLQTALPSLELEYGHNSAPSYAAAGQKLPSEKDPLKVYDRLYGNGVPTPGSTTPVVDAKALRNQSVMDFVAREFGHVVPKLKPEDRLKLEAHGDVVRDLENRLAKLAEPQQVLTGCTAVDRGSLSTAGSRPIATRNMFFDSLGDSMFSLVASAFSCDMVRVATIGVGTPPGELWNYSDGNFGSDNPHDLAHKTAGAEDQVDGKSNPQGYQAIGRMHAYHAQRFAKLLAALDAIPEGDGSTVLDNTVVLWAGQITDGGHAYVNGKWMVSGNAGGQFKTGQYLEFGDYYRHNWDPGGVPHGNLFTSLVNAFGGNIAKFGDPNACTGELDGLR